MVAGDQEIVEDPSEAGNAEGADAEEPLHIGGAE